MNEIVKFILVTCLASVLDACWTFAIIYSTRKKIMLATVWTGAGYLIAAINVLAYVSDRKMIIATVFGAMIGCFFSVKYV